MIKIRGPKTGKEEQYFKYGSSYSPDSLSSIVKVHCKNEESMI